MTSRGTAVTRMAFLALLITTSCGWAQTAAPPEATSTPASRPAGSLMGIVPADAWGVVGLNNLEQLDTEVMRIGQKLGLPIFFAPSGLIQMGLGITQGFNPAGGMAAIVLDGAKYPGAANWSMAQGFPLPVVLALAASDDKALIQSLGGKETDDPAVWSVTLQNEAVFAAAKDGYVLVGPDAAIIKSLTAADAPATQTASQALKPGFVKYASRSNLFIYVNAKSLLTTYGPVLKGMMAFVAAAMQGSQEGEGGAAAGQTLAVTVNTYIDVLSKQLDKAMIFANLEANGLHLSAVATFQEDTVLAKAFAAAKPSGKPLLAGLPGGAFVLTGAMEQSGHEFVQPVMDLFLKPYADALRASGNAALVAQAEQQAKLAEVRVQLTKLQQATQLGVYNLPKGEDGTLGVVVVGQFSDAAKAYELIRQNIKSQADFAVEQKPKAKDFLACVTYTPDAETVDGVKIHTLLVDLTKAPKLMGMPEPKAEEAIKVIKALFGPDGLKVRIAVSEKQVLASLGGGEAFLKQALAAAKSGKPALATQPAIVKASDRLPKDRLGALYVSAESVMQVVDRVAKAAGEPGLPFTVGETSVPLTAAMISDPLGLHVTLYVPTELAVSVKGMYNQTQAQQRGAQPQPRRGAASQPATPTPEF